MPTKHQYIKLKKRENLKDLSDEYFGPLNAGKVVSLVSR